MRSFISKGWQEGPENLVVSLCQFSCFYSLYICRLSIVEYDYEYYVVDYILSMKELVHERNFYFLFKHGVYKVKAFLCSRRGACR